MALHDEAAHMQHLLDTLGRAAGGVIHALYRSVGGDPDQIEQKYPTAIRPFLGASSALGAQWYHQLAPDSGFPVRTVPPPPDDQLAANVHWALTAPSTEQTPKPANPFEALSVTTERHVYDANRDTVTANADRENVMYARYASATACAFCRLLATREPIYSGKGVVTDPETGKQKLVVIGHRGTRKPGQDYHDNCKCLAVPVRPGEKYTPPDYVDAWRRQYEIAYKNADTHSLKDIVNHMRRQQYHQDKLASALGGADMTASPDATSVNPALDVLL